MFWCQVSSLWESNLNTKGTKKAQRKAFLCFSLRTLVNFVFKVLLATCKLDTSEPLLYILSARLPVVALLQGLFWRERWSGGGTPRRASADLSIFTLTSASLCSLPLSRFAGEGVSSKRRAGEDYSHLAMGNPLPRHPECSGSCAVFPACGCVPQARRIILENAVRVRVPEKTSSTHTRWGRYGKIYCGIGTLIGIYGEVIQC